MFPARSSTVIICKSSIIFNHVKICLSIFRLYPLNKKKCESTKGVKSSNFMSYLTNGNIFSLRLER